MLTIDAHLPGGVGVGVGVWVAELVGVGVTKNWGQTTLIASKKYPPACADVAENNNW